MTRAARSPLLLVAFAALGACAHAAPPTPAPPPRDAPRLDAVVRVHGVGDCLGVRIAPGLALTAAHCVLGVRTLGEVRVVAGLGRGGRPLRVTSCALHPALAARFARCDLADRNAADRIAELWTDLAVLGLADDAGDAPTLPLLRAAEPLSSLVDAQVWVVSDAAPRWFDEPAPWLHANTVTLACGGELRTRGAESAGLSTRPGDSGGPVFVRRDGRWVVAGILAGGESLYSADSRFAATFAAPTVDWLPPPR